MNPIRKPWQFAVILFFAATAASSQAAELNWAQKMFSELKHNFGVIARGSEARHAIVIKNIYKEQVHIASIRTTCGCSAGELSTRTLESREEATVEITMNTTKFTRQKDSNLIVTFDKPLYQEVTIPISAYIRTDVVFTPGSLDFGEVDQGTEQSRRISISYAGRADWAIQSVESGSPFIETELKEVQRVSGRVGYELIAKLKPGAPAGVLRSNLILNTDDKNAPKVPLLAEGSVKADITVTPATVRLQKMKPGEERMVRIVVRGKKPFTVSKVECEDCDGEFQVQLPNSEKTVHIIPMTIKAPMEAGNLEEEFSVVVPGRKAPVRFKAIASIEKSIQ